MTFEFLLTNTDIMREFVICGAKIG
jgi:hypothetical protein